MLVLGLAGSPRRGGNTEILLDEALSGAAGKGAVVEKIVLPGLKLSPCISCGVCDKKGVCAVRDGMHEIYDRIAEAGVIILASPVYFYNVTAQAKIVIDRAQASWSRRYVLKDPAALCDKKGGFIGVGATRGDKLFEGTCLTVKYFFDAVGCTYDRELLVRGIDEKGAIRHYPEQLLGAFEMGAALVEAAG